MFAHRTRSRTQLFGSRTAPTRPAPPPPPRPAPAPGAAKPAVRCPPLSVDRHQSEEADSRRDISPQSQLLLNRSYTSGRSGDASAAEWAALRDRARVWWAHPTRRADAVASYCCCCCYYYYYYY
eukprot:gene2124-biopygen3745